MDDVVQKQALLIIYTEPGLFLAKLIYFMNTLLIVQILKTLTNMQPCFVNKLNRLK